MSSDDDSETDNGDDEDDETGETDNGESNGTASGSWPMDRFTADNQMVADDRSGPDGPLEERWTTEVEDVTLSGPVIDHGLVYVADETPTLHAVDLASGEVEWTFEAELPPRAPSNPQWDPTTPAVTDDAVYFLTDKLYAVDPDEGEELWSIELGSLYAGDIRVFDGIVYVNNDGELYAIDTDDEDIIWEDEASGTEDIAVGEDGTLFVIRRTNNESDYEALAFDVFEDESLMTYSPSGNIRSGFSLMVQDKTIYTHDPASVVAIDAETGDSETVTEFEQTEETDPASTAPPSIANGLVYSGGTSRYPAVYATELDTGEEPDEWKSGNIENGPNGLQPFVSDDTLYIWRDLGYTHLHALDPETGAEQWTTYTLDHIETSLHGSMVEGYAVLEDSIVLTINSNTGQVIVTLEP
ncbi:PQQ-binding-like beta-propeller repeat protein [Natronorubrum texcoconense]|uniref:Outer membrane protein assembly factor BamB, contains PQQ-like beta-propeller repeat n=1 Tax=Natronorubrum texcoconense TaxID=1095776 RepID=A0A1G8TV17_9EURY|nr:PQQ-binding-like beta-propeller repeat protein [Natronorubrum texcoconense]SDJ45351.1 Outer membrane protein assembly factor BamB, contains PQQ-like beta-propeller repeat [Natronorubrum texcoconense]